MTRPKAAPSSSKDDLSFVNISHPDDIRQRKVQRGIRRHVMRDIGRSRRGPKHPVVAYLDVPVEESSSAAISITGTSALVVAQSGTTELSIRQDASRLVPQPRPRNVYPWPRSLTHLGHLPARADMRTLELLHFMAAETDGFRPLRRAWLTLSLSDTSAFHLSLAYAVIFLDQSRGVASKDFGDNTEAVQHYSRTITHLTPRLDDRIECVSAGVVSTILGFACHAANIRNWQRWKVHMDGLQKISSIRGGLDDLRDDIPILASWTDLVGAVVHDSHPRYPVPAELTSYADCYQEGTASWSRAFNSSGPNLLALTRAVQSLSRIATEINTGDHKPGFWTRDIDAIRMFIPVTHQLLSMPRPLENLQLGMKSHVLILHEMMRLSCLMLLASLKVQFGLGEMEMDSLQTRFSRLLGRDTMRELDSCLRPCWLWAAVVVSLLNRDTDRSPLVAECRAAMSTMGITEGRDAFTIARDIIWIEATLSQESGKLLNEIDDSM